MVIERNLPGLALQDSKGNTPFYKGEVIYASDRVQWIKTNNPEHKLVYLIGRTFLYWCERCKTDVWEAEVTQRGVRNCPFCQGRILALSPGDSVRLHFRYAADTSWSEWWAQRIV